MGSYETAYEDQVSGIEAAKDPVHVAGVATQSITAGQTATFVLTPTMEMQPFKLVIDDVIAASVDVVEITAGPINLNVGDGPIPGATFKPSSTVRFLTAVPIRTNQPLRVRIKNKSAATVDNVGFALVGRVKAT